MKHLAAQIDCDFRLEAKKKSWACSHEAMIAKSEAETWIPAIKVTRLRQTMANPDEVA
jgi:hypothetical protein